MTGYYGGLTMDFLPKLSTNKDEKPVAKPLGKHAAYDIDDIDGLLTMLNRNFSGCVAVSFTKRLNESIYGKVSIDGQELKKGTLFTFETMGGVQLYGFPVRGVLTEYNKSYTALLEGFVDLDGNMMEPQEITIITHPKKQPVPGYEAHDQVALDVAREGIVLLKNEDHVLPLPQTETLNIFGKGLALFRMGAVGAGKINPRYYVGLVQAIEECSNFELNQDLRLLYAAGIDVNPTEEILQAAYEKSKTALIVITRGTGENIDNSATQGEYYLTDEEEALVQTVSNKFEKTVAILNVGYPIDVSWVKKYNINGLVYCGLPGMLGGQALVEILDGRVTPSGKLPDTWSLDYYDIPASRNFYNAADGKSVLYTDTPVFVDTVYEEDIYVGYRYFETFGKQVAYPFGFGLSYTSFQVTITAMEYSNQHTKLVVEVQNTGEVPGKEVVQVFVEEPDGKLEKPSRKLAAFHKTKQLNPGEVQQLVFELDEDSYTSYDSETASWIMEAGVYTLWVGQSVKELTLAGSFELKETKTIFKVVNRMRPPIAITTLSKTNALETFPKGKDSGMKQDVTELFPKRPNIRKEPSEWHAEAPSRLIKYTEVIENPELLSSFVAQLSVEELARLSVCASTGWGMHEKGEAGRVFLLEKYDMKPYVVADGNSGVNVKKPNIGMPTSTMLCATYNTELAQAVGSVIAEEAKENDIHMILAPGMNIHRNPLNGRHPEYFSEDPLLSGIIAGHLSKGLEENNVSSCLKHVVANNCESVRKRNNSIMTERAMREIYLKTFEIAIKVHKPDSLMTGYNASNGVFTAEDEEMIMGVFREEFQFDGFVMTDWASYDTCDVVSAVQAGNSWMTPGTLDDTYVTPIIEGVKDGRIDLARLQENIYYMLRVMIKRSR